MRRLGPIPPALPVDVRRHAQFALDHLGPQAAVELAEIRQMAIRRLDYETAKTCDMLMVWMTWVTE